MQGPRITPEAVPTTQRTTFQEFPAFGAQSPLARSLIERATAFRPLAGQGAQYFSRLAGQLPGVDEGFVANVLAPTRQRLLGVELPEARGRLASQFAQAGTFFGSPHARAQAELEERVLGGLSEREAGLRAGQFGTSVQRIDAANRFMTELAGQEPGLALAPLQYLLARFLPTEQTGTSLVNPQYGPSIFQQLVSLVAALAPAFG